MPLRAKPDLPLRVKTIKTLSQSHLRYKHAQLFHQPKTHLVPCLALTSFIISPPLSCPTAQSSIKILSCEFLLISRKNVLFSPSGSKIIRLTTCGMVSPKTFSNTWLMTWMQFDALFVICDGFSNDDEVRERELRHSLPAPKVHGNIHKNQIEGYAC